MEVILNFLKDNFYSEPNSLLIQQKPSSVSDKDLKSLNNLFRNSDLKSSFENKLCYRPQVKPNQIWSLKNEYFDSLGKQHVVIHPILVIITSETDLIETEEYTRVNVISPFIEFAAKDDWVCEEASIIGFPFLIEEWNNQPILTEVLDECVGYFDMEQTKTSSHIQTIEGISEQSYNHTTSLNFHISEFRATEVSNAKYLSNSVTALLTFLENKQTSNSGVVISIFNNPIFPDLYTSQQQNNSLSLAAKTGTQIEDYYFKHKDKVLPFDIIVRKNEEGFIITINPAYNVQLFNASYNEVIGIIDDGRIIFHQLQSGLYHLTTEENIGPITIRVK